MPGKKDQKHVVLSKETVDKLLQKEPEPQRLSPWDILALERSETEVKLARAAMGELVFRIAGVRSEAELAVMRLNEERRKANVALNEAQKAHQLLAGQIANKYDFAWTTHSYNPDTGEVLSTD